MNVRLKPLISAEEFERMSNADGHELIDGELREKGVGAESSWVQTHIGYLLKQWCEAGGHGWVFDSECGYICFPHRPKLVRKPDASFVRRGRLAELPRGYFRLVPDLAVEVVSPNDLCYELEDRVRDYLSVSVPMLWVVYPGTRTVYVYRAGGQIRWLSGTDELDADPVLPGFRVQVANFFPSASSAAEPTESDSTQP